MTTVTNTTPGLDLGKLFNQGIENLSSKGEALQKDMQELLKAENVSPEDMMQIQFQMGQYNATLESLSSVTKSLTDTLKSLSQRAG